MVYEVICYEQASHYSTKRNHEGWHSAKEAAAHMADCQHGHSLTMVPANAVALMSIVRGTLR